MVQVLKRRVGRDHPARRGEEVDLGVHAHSVFRRARGGVGEWAQSWRKREGRRWGTGAGLVGGVIAAL